MNSKTVPKTVNGIIIPNVIIARLVNRSSLLILFF